jgi:MoaA/NifB/PqqE/SkfB family radical SAM enzyme
MHNSKVNTVSAKEQAARVELRYSRNSIFSFRKEIKALKAVLAYKLFNKRTPLSVTFFTTSRCNFDCQTCGVQSIVESEIPHERFISIIDEVAATGAIRVSFTGGGEPMMRDDIGELILRAKKNGLIVSMVTNGFFIDKKLDQIRDLDLLLVSYDKSKQLIQKDIPVLGKILENAILAKNSGIPVCLQPLLTKDTCLHIEDYFTISQKYGFVLSLQSLENWYQSTVPTENMPNREEMTTAIGKILAEKKRNNNILNSKRYLDLLAEYWQQPFQKTDCFAGVFYANVSPDGYLYSCIPLMKKVPARNLIYEPFGPSFQEMPIAACPGCLWNCHHELNNIFSIDLGTLWNLIRFSKNKLVYRY